MLRTSFTTLLLLMSAALALVAAPMIALLWNGSTPVDAQGDVERPAPSARLPVDTGEGSLDVSSNWNAVRSADDYPVR